MVNEDVESTWPSIQRPPPWSGAGSSRPSSSSECQVEKSSVAKLPCSQETQVIPRWSEVLWRVVDWIRRFLGCCKKSAQCFPKLKKRLTRKCWRQKVLRLEYMHSAYPPEKSWEEIFAGAGYAKFFMVGFGLAKLPFCCVLVGHVGLVFQKWFFNFCFFCACNFFNLQSCWLLKTYLWYMRHNQSRAWLVLRSQGRATYSSTVRGLVKQQQGRLYALPDFLRRKREM